ncbi:hypothetical protein LTR56_025189 [Elasticomyces elasticus]|nr:hypothetical protein LTR56_025189 [Elasticomyces elasticus]KAK3649254.1 hypothetical protein LTR22_012983 [Elasticomyces elasticus]KAK4928212.1 hypothetical protein LTR49_005150 [Elasticomyces elasticus]KAK5765966.1 hypothetical protein LTS12_003973 [Elasticomyces elasticus]
MASEIQQRAAAIADIKEAVSEMGGKIQTIQDAVASISKDNKTERQQQIKRLWTEKYASDSKEILRIAQLLWSLLDRKRMVDDNTNRTYAPRPTPAMAVRVEQVGQQFFAIVTRNAIDEVGNQFSTPQVLIFKLIYADNPASAMKGMLGLVQEILAKEAPLSINGQADWVEVEGYGTYSVVHKGHGRDDLVPLPQPLT